MTVNHQPMGRFLLIIAFIAFISLGLPDGLLGVAWPTMRADFGMPLDAMGALLIALVAGYTVSTVFSGKLVRMMGIGRLLGLSCLLTSIALMGYTLAPVWIIVLFLGVLAGFGGGAIDAGVNNYIAQRHRQLLYLLHAMFGVGTTIGPLIMTTALNVATWRTGYIIVSVFQFGLAMVFFYTANRWAVADEAQKDDDAPADVRDAGLRQTARLPIVWFSTGLFFVYTGLELGLGQWAYTLMTEGRGIDTNTAGFFVGMYWGAFTVGRLVSGLIVRYIDETTFLRMSFTGVVGGSILLWWNPVEIVGLIALPIIGFSLAPIFPALIGSTEERTGTAHAANTIGFQIGAASIGSALLPGLAGALARAYGIEMLAVSLVVGAIAVTGLHEVSLFLRDRRKQKRAL